MRKILTLGLVSFILVGCSDATRTVPVLVIDERTISGDRPALTIPPDYRNPTLPQPKEDTVLQDWNKNNFIGPMPKVSSTPLPPRRPCSIDNRLGCK
jgi:uncharacterized protein YcfL